MTDRQKPKRPEVRGHLSPAHYAEALEQYVEELDAYYGDLLRRAADEILDLMKCLGSTIDDESYHEGKALISEIREHLEITDCEEG